MGVFLSSQPVIVSSIESSPRSWGCFPPFLQIRKHYRVFPTLVGVFLPAVSIASVNISLPHARGGVSVSVWDTDAAGRSSPRSWGCFVFALGGVRYNLVFPTLVGVFPTPKK